MACDNSQKLSCPSCPAGYDCKFTVPTNCLSCSKSVCVPDSSPSGDDGGSTSSSSGSGGTDVGAIAGGVIGGIAFLAIISYLVWRYFVKPRRSQERQSVYEPERQHAAAGEKDNASRLTRRSSTHTVHSIASTVLTRASNIIQIAYIPGVTNRATPTSPNSPSVLVPPVPPIPSQHATGGRQDDQHFFMPGDLRDSTYSGYSGYSDRTSYAHTSYAPRSSIASTIYGKQAEVAAPAQAGVRAKPTMVSVRSAASGGSGSPGSTPPVPNIDFDRFGGGRPKSGASAFSVGSTFLNNANTATPARAQVIKVGSGLKRIELGNKADSNTASPSSTSPPSPSSSGDRTTKDSLQTFTIIDDTPVMDQGPFSDPPSGPATPLVTATPAGLEAVVEGDEDEETQHQPRRLSRHLGATGERTNSPFGDQHATRE